MPLRHDEISLSKQKVSDMDERARKNLLGNSWYIHIQALSHIDAIRKAISEDFGISKSMQHFALLASHTAILVR